MTTNGTMFERHFQTGIQVIIMIIITWFGNKTIDTSYTVIRLEEQMTAMRADIATATANRFTSVDATSTARIVDMQFRAMNQRLLAIEKKINNN